MNYTQQFVKGSFFLFVGSVVAAVFAYLIKLVLVHNLTVEEYGLFFAVFTLVLILSVFQSLGLGQGLVRFLAECNVKQEYGRIKSLIFGSILIKLAVSLLVVGVLWFFSDLLAEHYFATPEAKWLLRILSLYLPLNIAFTDSKAILNGLKNNKWLGAVEPIKQTLILTITLLSIYLGFGLLAPVHGYILGMICLLFIFLIVIMKNHSFWRYKKEQFFIENKKLLLFSLPLVFAGAGVLIITYIDTLILTYFDTLTAVGVYNIIYPSALMIGLIGISLSTILLPIVSELWSQNKKRQLIKAFDTIYKFLILLCVPTILTLMVLAAPAIRILFGAEYLIGVVAFNILLIGAFFKIIAMINYRSIIGLGDSKSPMNIYIAGALINVLLNLILIPPYSLTGAAIATTITFILMTTLSFMYLRKKVLVKIPYRHAVIATASALMMPLFAHYVPIIFPLINLYVTTILGIVIGGILYLGIIYLSRTVSVQEIQNLLKRM